MVREHHRLNGYEFEQTGGNGNPLQYSCLENPMNRVGGLWSRGGKELDMNLATEQQVPAIKCFYPEVAYISSQKLLNPVESAVPAWKEYWRDWQTLQMSPYKYKGNMLLLLILDLGP